MKSTQTLFFTLTFCALLSFNARSQQQCNGCNPGLCNGNIYSDKFTSLDGWTYLHDATIGGSIEISPAHHLHYDNIATGGLYNRIYKQLPNFNSTNSNDFWADCIIRVSGGNAPAGYIMAFTAGSQDPWVDENIQNTNQDGIWVMLIQTANGTITYNCCPFPGTAPYEWRLVAYTKDGNNSPVEMGSIDLPSLNTLYGVRLIRHNDCGFMEVYSNAAFTNQISGSPVCFSVPSTCTDFSYVQLGAQTGGYFPRSVNMDIDNLKVCSSPGCDCQNLKMVSEVNDNDDLEIGPNPTSGKFTLQINDFTLQNQKVDIVIRDESLRVVQFWSGTLDADLTRQFDLTSLAPGIYAVSVMADQKNYNKILVKQ